jgi:vacuolar protein sorting-associated protein 13A/C
MKTWKNPIGKRELIWTCGDSANQVFDLETLQATKKFNIGPARSGFTLSFLDGLQKVLIFVENLEAVNDEASGLKEVKGAEYILDLNSLSLSLVDDVNRVEILYASITSSGISWGEKNKSKTFKPFDFTRINLLEQAYQNYMEKKDESSSLLNSSLARSFENQAALTSAQFSYKIIPLNEQDGVDFERMILYLGKKEISVERQFAPSLYVSYFGSPSHTNLHLMVHKLQIDNQLYDCMYPVMFSKVLPPKSVALTSK